MKYIVDVEGGLVQIEDGIVVRTAEDPLLGERRDLIATALQILDHSQQAAPVRPSGPRPQTAGDEQVVRAVPAVAVPQDDPDGAAHVVVVPDSSAKRGRDRRAGAYEHALEDGPSIDHGAIIAPRRVRRLHQRGAGQREVRRSRSTIFTITSVSRQQ
jgi:hypothetical protein